MHEEEAGEAMTVIAWDGKTIAADKRAVCAGVHYTTIKLRRVKIGDHIPEVLAWTGDQDSGEMVAQWYANGADAAKWPECQKDKESWCRLIVVDQYGARFFERQPVAVKIEDAFCAWGSGRDFALAALHLGKSAREAVEIACVFDTNCGNGVDVVELWPKLAVA